MMTMKDVDGYFWVDSNVIEKNFYVLKKEMNKNKWKKRKNEESLLAIKKKEGGKERKKKEGRERSALNLRYQKLYVYITQTFFIFLIKTFFFKYFLAIKKKRKYGGIYFKYTCKI